MKKRMKSKSSLFSLGFAALVFLATAFPASADLCPTGDFARLCNLNLTRADSIVGSIITVLLIFAVIVAVIFIIIGGIRWVMSGGDKSKVESARGTITGAVIGIIIALSAYFILNVVTYLFTGKVFTNFVIPTIVP
jgi:hypothetical protein